LCALLERLAEELNRIEQKPSTERRCGDGTRDDELAWQAGADHLLQEDSIIGLIVDGQLRVEHSCRTCSAVRTVRAVPSVRVSRPAFGCACPNGGFRLRA
jgi:hypothetical protein